MAVTVRSRENSVTGWEISMESKLNVVALPCFVLPAIVTSIDVKKQILEHIQEQKIVQ